MTDLVPPPEALLRYLEKRAWRRRLIQAARDGLEVEGAVAVYKALRRIIGVPVIKSAATHARGTPPKPWSEGYRNAAREWLKDPSIKQEWLAKHIAGESAQAFSKRLRENPKRWTRLLGNTLADMIPKTKLKQKKWRPPTK
jgi:hypothetical protein